MFLLDPQVRPYAWGSRTALAELRGLATPTTHPEAELWFGAHEGGPAKVADTATNLLDHIAADPVGQLGSGCAEHFGNRLPFLVKLLAAEEPLSLQAHPSAAQAAAGFAHENALGIDLNASTRNYRDGSHKPEILVALTEFAALAGFREPAQTVALLDALQVPELAPARDMLASQPDLAGLRAAFTMWITLPEAVLTDLISPLLAAAVRYLNSGGGEWSGVAATVLDLGERYPSDPGVLAALLLNHVVLQPGEAVFLAAGNLHAYLSGVGVEVMANSDNVLRGGLTPKHVDVPELLRVLDFHPITPEGLRPKLRQVNAERIYETDTAEFQLSRIELSGTGLHHPTSIAFDRPGPQVLLCTTGEIEIVAPDKTLLVPQGSAAWVGDSDPDVTVHARSTSSVFFRGLVPAS